MDVDFPPHRRIKYYDRTALKASSFSEEPNIWHADSTSSAYGGLCNSSMPQWLKGFVSRRVVQEREVKAYVVDIPELGTTDFLKELARTKHLELFETEVVQVVLRYKWASFGWTVHVLLMCIEPFYE